ncbi:hypothetical protein EGW08_018431, partial [Elysia chlorotica]
MLFQTSSLFLTSMAISSIMTSFLGCNLIYRVVYDFSACYRRASKSMMNTSLTTFAAFISNYLSPLMGVNTFGIFSATLVMVNFLSTIIFFPACVIMYHKDMGPNFSPALNISLPTSEIKLQPFFDDNTRLYERSHVNSGFYRYFETMASYWLNNNYTDELLPEYGTYSVMIGMSTDEFDMAPILSDPEKYYGTRLRYAAIEITLSLLHSSVDFEEGLEIYQNWEDFADREIALLPPSLQGGVQFSPGGNERNTWHDDKSNKKETLARPQSHCVFRFSLFQVIESINLSLVVGLAVDYVVHLSEAYHTSPQTRRTDKVRDMLEHMGVSVVSGAFSTLGSASFMMAAQIQFFVQFGVFLFLTIGFSLIYSLFLFTPLLSVIGPEGHTGSVLPIARWIWYKIIGRKKEDVKCETCEGKGYHGPLS